MTEQDIDRIQSAVIHRVTEAGPDGLDVETLITTLVYDHVAHTEWDAKMVLLAMGIASAEVGVLFTSSGRLRLLQPGERKPLPYDAH